MCAGVLAAATLLAACSSGGDGAPQLGNDSGGAADGDRASIPDMATDELASGEIDADGPAPAGGVDLVAATEGRKIISTAFVDLTTPDADEVADRITQTVTRAGGFISGQDTSRVDGTRTTLVLRVPPDGFDEVLDRLADLGELTAQRIETDEVTEQVVDLESRITTAEASVVRLRALLDRSGNVSDIAQVETELLGRETTLETLRGQLRTIERQVDLATITVTISADDTAPVIDDKDEGPSFLAGFGAGWNALTATLAAAAAALGALLPWLVLATIVALPVRRLMRNRRRPAPSASPA